KQESQIKQESLSPSSQSVSTTSASSKKVLRIGIAFSALDREPSESGDYRDPLDAFKLDYFGNDWYSNGVIRGLNQVALQDNLVIELLGTPLDQPILLSRRIELSSPDVFVCIGPPLRYASVIGEARRQGIPSVLAMIRAPEIGVPNIYEDNYAGSWDAVHRLYELGHRRIGFVQILTSGGWWSIDRYEGYRKALADHGLEINEALSLWVPQIVPQDGPDIIRRYLHRQHPTAVIFGCFRATFYLKELIKNRELSIPQDLSVITYDQLPLIQHFLGGVQPSTIALPLREVGETIGRLARIIVEKPKNVPPKTMLPCHFIEGNSTAPYQA
ncbi:MAG: substrate-binding domain-containing protein, partial [Planctomycetia bacterium]|nr:substrate-binding domain-containing protein [Planctomycetia bacterium]